MKIPNPFSGCRACMSLLLGWFLLSGSGLRAQVTDTLEIRVAGMVRYAIVYHPPSSVPPQKVIFAFHGAGMNMYQMQANILAAANAHEDYLWVFPQALETHKWDQLWKKCRPGTLACEDKTALRAGWQVAFPYMARQCKIMNDLEYLKKLRSQVLSSYEVDKERLFAFGYSSGGFFTFSHMTILPHLFKKYAVFGAVSNYYPVPLSYDCDDNLGEMAAAASQLKGYKGAPFRPALPKPAPSDSPPIYYIIGREDGVIGEIVQNAHGYPLFDSDLTHNSGIKITFLELLYRHAGFSMTNAYHNELGNFLSSVNGVTVGNSFAQDYGPQKEVKIEVFRSTEEEHFMRNYRTGTTELMDNVIAFFER